MPNPIRTSDLYQDTGELQKLIQQLKEAQAAYEAMLETVEKRAKVLKKGVEGLNVAQSENRDQLRKAAIEAAKLEKAQQKYQEAISETAKDIAKLKLATQEANRIKKLEVKLANAAKGSYEALSAQYSLNKIRLNKMSKEEREATQAGKELEKQTKEIYEEMKRLQEATGKHTLNVGNYKEATRELLDELKIMPTSLEQAAVGVKALGRGLKALLANPIVLFISLIVGALGALFGAFKKSEKGAQLMAKASGFLKAGMAVLTKIATGLADKLGRLFSDPMGSIKDFGKAILENVTNRFKGVLKLVKSLAKGVKGLLTFSLQDLKEAASEAGSAMIQVGTGFDEKKQMEIAKSFRETTSAVQDLTSAFIKLEESRRSIARQNIAIAKTIEQLRTEEQRLLAIQEDDTRGFEERQAAAIKAREATIAVAREEIKLARNNLALINKELSLRKSAGENTLELEQQQLEAYRALKMAEREYTLALLDGDEKRRRLKQDELERDLDILIDGFDNQKTINERKIADDRRTFEERRKILEETVKLGEESFKKQIAVIQSLTDKQVDANDLLATSDAVLLNQKIRSLGLSEIIEGRLLEIIRDRRTAVLDLQEAEQELLAAEKKAREERLAEAYKAELESFDQQQALREAEFNIVKRTEAEKTVFRLQAERERLEKLVELGQKYAGQVSQVEIETYKATIKGIERQLQEASSGQGLFDTLGISVTQEQQEQLKSSLDTAKGELQEWVNFRNRMADEAVAAADREIDAARERLQAEVEARNQGFAHSVQTAEKELQQAEANRRKALEQKRRAQRAEQLINSVQQASNLLTASTKIWAQFGFPAALLPLSVLWGSFIASKVRAFNLTKPNREGSFEWLGAGGQQFGAEDIALGYTRDGRLRTASRGEGLAIFNRRASVKYGKILPEIVKAINAGQIERVFSSHAAQDNAGATIVTTQGISTGKVESVLERIYEQGQEKSYTDERGRLVIQRGNKRIIYV